MGLFQSFDTFVSSMMSLLPFRLDFIYDLFEKVGSRNNEEKMGTARRKPTVSSQFRVSNAGSLRLFDTCSNKLTRDVNASITVS